jgi:glutathione peroxidase-family protein
MATFYDFEMQSITGEAVPLSEYEGQVCLVVNVASK